MTMEDESTKDTKGKANGLPAGWERVDFNDAFRVVSVTYKVKQRDYLPTGSLPVVDQGQELVGGYTDDSTMQLDCDLPVIVFGDHTKVLKYVPFHFAAGADGIKVLKPTGLFEPKFLFYYLKLVELPDKGYARHFQYLRKVEFVLPPLAEQEHIVSKLEELFTQLDAAVAGLKRVQAALKHYRTAVLKAACEGRLVPQDPNDEPAAKLLERILAERRAKWEADLRANGKDPAKAKYEEPRGPDTSGLPELPVGWCWATLEQLITELKNGYFSQTPGPEPPGVPILRISAVRPMRVDLNEIRYLNEVNEDKAKPYYLRDGDLLFTRYNGNLALVGACGVVRGHSVPLIYPDKLIRARTIDGLVVPDYIEVYFATEELRKIIEKKAKSTAGQQGIAGSDLKKIPIALPSLSQQHKIVNEVQRRLSLVQVLERTLESNYARAERLRQAILRRAFEGKLVPNGPANSTSKGFRIQLTIRNPN
jgi:type I restriction enzyme, S subunit